MSDGGSWNTEYGHFFLSWYSRQLLQHADRVLGAAAAALNKRGRPRKAMAVREVSSASIMIMWRRWRFFLIWGLEVSVFSMSHIPYALQFVGEILRV